MPAYGPLAVAFPNSGYQAHREGVVVEFTDREGDRWIGNFQPGLSGFNCLFDTLDADRAIVVAGGAGYLVDLQSRRAILEFGGTIEWALALPEKSQLILADGIKFQALGKDGLLWTSERISWDGMKDVKRDGNFIRGEAYSPLDDAHKSFDLDLRTGALSGGSFEGNWMSASSRVWAAPALAILLAGGALAAGAIGYSIAVTMLNDGERAIIGILLGYAAFVITAAIVLIAQRRSYARIVGSWLWTALGLVVLPFAAAVFILSEQVAITIVRG